MCCTCDSIDMTHWLYDVTRVMCMWICIYVICICDVHVCDVHVCDVHVCDVYVICMPGVLL